MSEELQQILSDVAAGTLSPDEATARIEGLKSSATDVARMEPAHRLVVKGGAVRLNVVGDPTVAEAVADGPHRMERDGDTLIVSTDMSDIGYSTEPPRSAFMNWLNQVMDRVGVTLTVRVNPDLPIQVLVVGGTLDVTGLRSGASVGVEGGSAHLADGAGPLQVDVTSGSARVDWTFTGHSKIRADMGSATVTVRPGSDVTITTEASLGQGLVKAHDGIHKAQADQPSAPVVVGAGTGSLHAAARMGSVQVTVA